MTKKILILLGLGLGIAGAMNMPDLETKKTVELKARPEMIFYSEDIDDIRCDDNLKNCVNLGKIKKYYYITDEIVKPKIRNGKEEIMSKRTHSSHTWIKERKNGKITYETEIIAGSPYAENKETGAWNQIESSTTTIDNFDKRTNKLSVKIKSFFIKDVYATVSTFYSNASGDGHVFSFLSGQPSQAIWDSAHDATSGTVQDSITEARARIDILGVANEVNIWRVFLPFDVSAIPDTDTIDSADLSVWPTEVLDQYNDAYGYIGVIQTSQASETSLTANDYDNVGVTKGAADWDITGISTGSYQTIALNATGLGWIDATGYTLIGLREGHDIEDVFPGDPGEADKRSSIKFYTSDQTGTDNDPKLVITHTSVTTFIPTITIY